MENSQRSLVVIIEDDGDIRRLLAEHFSEDYDVLTANNGEQAVDLVRSLKRLPCVVFLDLMMPVMNGWEFLRVVEHEGLLPDVAIVVITAAGSTKVPKEVTFLTKPVDLYRLTGFAERYCTMKEKA